MENGFESIARNVIEYTVKSKGRIKFDLTNFDMKRAVKDVGRSAAEADSYTNWEFNLIMGSKKYRDATDFYRGGERTDTKTILKEYKNAKN